MAVGMLMVGSGAGGMSRDTELEALRLVASLLSDMGRWLVYARHSG